MMQLPIGSFSTSPIHIGSLKNIFISSGLICVHLCNHVCTVSLDLIFATHLYLFQIQKNLVFHHQ